MLFEGLTETIRRAWRGPEPPRDQTIMSPAIAAPATTIQQAFTEAVAEHSPKASEPAAPASPETSPPAVTTDEPTPAPAPSATSADPHDLLTDAEVSELEKTHGDDPKAMVKAVKRLLTQKSTALADQRKALEPYADLIKSLDTDAAGTIAALGKQYGLTVTPTEQERRVAAVQPAVNDAVASFKAALGPDLDFLGDKLAPAIQALAQHIVEQTVQPLKAHQQQLTERAGLEQTQTILKTFETKHPDWKQHEVAMVALSQKIQPTAGMESLDYMDLLYGHVTRDAAIATAVQAALNKIAKGAETDDASARAVPANQIEVVSRKPFNIRDAFKEAQSEVASRAGVR